MHPIKQYRHNYDVARATICNDMASSENHNTFKKDMLTLLLLIATVWCKTVRMVETQKVFFRIKIVLYFLRNIVYSAIKKHYFWVITGDPNVLFQVHHTTYGSYRFWKNDCCAIWHSILIVKQDIHSTLVAIIFAVVYCKTTVPYTQICKNI